MYSCSRGVGRYVASEVDYTFLPRGYQRDGSKTGIVICHGAGTNTGVNLLNESNVSPNTAGIISSLARFWPLAVCDLGGITWGNTTSQTRVGQAITWLQSASGGGAKTGKVVLIGFSMGHAVAFNYAKNSPANVAGVVGVIPACDLDDIRDNDRLAQRSAISTAWGTGTWTAPGTPALPAGANPATSWGGMVGIPHRLYYSTGDTVCLPATVAALAGHTGATAVSIGSTDHSDAACAGLPVDDLLTFIRSVA